MGRKMQHRAECFDCSWTDYDAKSTASARRHRDQTGHTTACVSERDNIYRGADTGSNDPSPRPSWGFGQKPIPQPSER